jgi:hypothetical protein
MIDVSNEEISSCGKKFLRRTVLVRMNLPLDIFDCRHNWFCRDMILVIWAITMQWCHKHILNCSFDTRIILTDADIKLVTLEALSVAISALSCWFLNCPIEWNRRPLCARRSSVANWMTPLMSEGSNVQFTFRKENDYVYKDGIIFSVTWN